MPELEPLCEMNQVLSAKRTAEDANMNSYFCESVSQMELVWVQFLESQQPGILECKTDKYKNAEVVKDLKKWINQQA